MMKKLIFTIAAVFFLSETEVSAQCDTTVLEAVRNGDFDAGYIPGDFNSDHTNASSIVDNLIGDTIVLSGCNWATGNQYYISSNDVVYSCEWKTYTGTPFNPDYGRSGLDGDSDVIMYVDPSAENDAKVWEQTVTVQPNQIYYYSFWYLTINNPPIADNNFNMKVDGVNQPRQTGITKTVIVARTVTRVDAFGNFVTDVNGNLVYDTITAPVTWTQTIAQYTTLPGQTSATIGIHTTGVDIPGYEFALDNISFINSCQNLGTNAKPIFTADTINFCASSSIPIDISTTYADNAITMNNTYSWYKDGILQKEQNALTYTGANSIGVYTICVEDPDNGCPVAANVVLKSLPSNPDLCNPETCNIDSTVQNSGSTLKANQSGASYRWLGCTNNHEVILGEKDATYAPLLNGQYAVEITLGSCIDTSNCETISAVGVTNYNRINQAVIYPNPTTGSVTVARIKGANLKVFNIFGQLVHAKNNIDSNLYQFTLASENGIYIIELTVEGQKARIKLIVND